MSVGNTVMVFGIGDLGGWVLEFLARRQGVTTIIGCDKREDWGSRKVNSAASGSGAEGYCKTIKFEKCDVFDIGGTIELIRKYEPHLIYTAMTQMSWKVFASAPQDVRDNLKKIASTTLPMHLTLPYKLMQAVKKSGSTAVCINTSWPDLVNPMLWRSGLKILVGGGNLDNITAEIRRQISVRENVPIRDVKIYLISEHAVNTMGTRTGVPYFFKVVIGDKDVTSSYDVDSLMSDRLYAPCPYEWISWIMHPQVASSAVKNIMAVLNDTNEFTHSPGPNGLIGGYPIRIGAKGVKIELPEELTLEQAIKINVDDAKYEGVEEIKDDGTLVLTDEACKITKKLLGVGLREYRAADSPDLAKELLQAFQKLGDKYGVKIPVY